MTLSPKKLLFAGITVAAVIGAASVAFACLVTKGQITLTTASGAGQTVKSNGTGVGMGICVSPSLAASVARGGRITVAVAPSKCGANPTDQLVDGTTLKVVLQYSNSNPGWTRMGAGSTWTMATNNMCWDANRPITATLSSTFSVSSGSGVGDFRIPSTANVSDANEAAQICVRDALSRGAFAPLVIT